MTEDRREQLRRALEANTTRRRRPLIRDAVQAIVPAGVSETAFQSISDTEALQDFVEGKVGEPGTSRTRWTMDLMSGALQAVASYSATPGPVLLVPRSERPAEAVELQDCSVLAVPEQLIAAVPYFALVSPDRSLGLAFDWGWRDYEGEWAELATWGPIGGTWAS